MKPTLYTVQRASPGRLSTMAKPRGGDWLDDEMRDLRHFGAHLLVCALTPPEASELALADEPNAARRAGLDFHAFPITDRGVPDRSSLLTLTDYLAARLRSGHHVLIHCRYGIGRSSLLAAAVLVREGVDADSAWQLLQLARGRPVPDTDDQRSFIATLISSKPSDP